MGKGHKNKVAVISGASSGLGQAFAHQLAEDGVHVAIVDLDEKGAADTVKMVQGAGCEAAVIKCDVTSPAEVENLAAEVNRRFGRCDILINNAGIYPSQSFDQISFADWRRVMSLNLDSLFLMSKAFVPGMRHRGWGRIVNLSSSVFGMTVPNFVHYIASKGGVVGFTRALAEEVGQFGITVNAIAPGLTRSPGSKILTAPHGGEAMFQATANRQPINRVEEPSDLIGAISFLASDDAAFITGQTLYINGGMHKN